MREFSIEASDFPGCCGITVISGFDGNYLGNAPLSSDEWYGLIQNTLRVDSWDGSEDFNHLVEPMIVFTGADWQSKSSCSPQKFATFLRRQGETVTESKKATNNITKIRAYTWAPSVQFRKKYNKLVDEKNKKNDERGARAA